MDTMRENYYTKEESESKVKDYFYNKKVRQTYYSIAAIGSGSDEPVDFFIPLNEEEFAHLKQQFVDAHNSCLNENEPKISSFEEIDGERVPLEDIRAMNEEINSMFNILTTVHDMECVDIDLHTPHYLYEMSFICYNLGMQIVEDKKSFKVELTDEEYISLLAQQLANREGFTFNTLAKDNPQLANKIVEGSKLYDEPSIDLYGHPYMVLLDEVLADAEAIDGPISVFMNLFKDINNEDSKSFGLSVGTHTIGRDLYIENTSFQGDYFIIDEIVVDADEIMCKMEAPNYYQMLKKLKERFNKETAHDDIIEWLNEERIDFKYGPTTDSREYYFPD